MAFSIYEASIPVFQQMLKNLSGLLEKADTYAKANNISEEELVNSRLYPDMFELKRQIQIATDHAKGAAARLAGADVPSFPDTETTIESLQARINKTLDFISSFPPEQFEGGEERAIKLVFPWATFEFNGSRYLTYWALPNFFFHTTTAYDILRHKGVNVGKADFIGQ